MSQVVRFLSSVMNPGCIPQGDVLLFELTGVPDGILDFSYTEVPSDEKCGCDTSGTFSNTINFQLLVNGSPYYVETRSFSYCGVFDIRLEIVAGSPLIKKTLNFNSDRADIDIFFQLSISNLYDNDRLNWLVWTPRIKINNAAQLATWQHYQGLLRGKYGRGFLLVDGTVTGEFFINFVDLKPGYYNCYNPWLDPPRDEHIPGDATKGQLIAWNGGPLQTGNLLANRLVLEFDVKCQFTVELIGWNQILFARSETSPYDEVYFF